MNVIFRQTEILYALIVRDMMVRFGRQNLGFVWTILEPMILTSGVMIIWSLIKEPVVHGIPVIAFVMTGYLPLTVNRHLSGATTALLRSQGGLLYHAPITHVHIMLARLILEFLSTTMALLVVYFIVVSTGLIEPVANPGLALAGWLLCAWHFGAIAVLLGVATEYWEPLEKFIQPYQYLQLPVSGVFFMVDWMPSYAQKLLMWNPSVSVYEMFRAGFFGDEIITHFDASYLIMVTAATTVIAAIALANVRSHLDLH
jgi:capsular polysaccharide transport system permease protein